MIRKFSLTICAALALACAAGAVASAELHNRKGASAKPASGDTAKSADVIDAGAGLTSGAVRAPKKMQAAAPLSADALIEGLAGIRHERGGGDTVVPVPEKVQMILRGKSSVVEPNKVKGKLVQITNTGVSPYASIGMIMSGCTGALVMNNYVLTSPWCVYNMQTKKFYDNLDFIPALNGNDAPVGTFKWKNVWIPKGFQDTGDLALAFALIELEGQPGDQMGWFGFGPVEGSENLKKLTVTGYPFIEVPKSTMWEGTCIIDFNEENAYFYRCPGKGATVVTMLGAPFFKKGGEGEAGQLLGIHTGSQDDKQNSWWAMKMNAAHTETILSWANGGEVADEEPEEETEEEATDEVAECTCEE